MPRLLFVFLYLFNILYAAGQDMLLIDKRFKEPPQYISEFQSDQFFNKKFPVYSSEIHLIKQNANAIARMLDRFDVNSLQDDTLYAGHSKFIFLNNQNGYSKEITVILSTRINDMELNLTLIEQEQNKRNAQLILLGLADYLSIHVLTSNR